MKNLDNTDMTPSEHENSPVAQGGGRHVSGSKPVDYLIGVDLGTQGTKASLLEETGRVAGEAFVPSRLIYPEPGAVEQDPEEMLESVLRAIREVMDASGADPARVAGIGMDGQMAGIMGVGGDGMAVTPYDSWLDTRCGKYRGAFLEYGEEAVIRSTGCPVTYAHGPKIMWWKNERPQVYEKIAAFVPPAAYCAMRMCGLGGGEAFTDYTYIHFSGFSDTRRKRWSGELLSALGVDPGKMPRIVRPYDRIGGLTPKIAAACGLLAGTPMVAGCGDTAASSFGAGVFKSGRLFDVAGTASVFACATDSYSPDTKHRTILFAPSVADGLYTPMAYINGGGMCLKWFRDDVLSGTRSYRELDEAAEKIPPGSENLFFLPHFSGRVCPNDPHVRGSYVNLGWQHGAAHLYRSIMEGIAYEYGIYKDIIMGLSPHLTMESVTCVGGGSKSRVFNQIKADVLGIPISTINLADTAALACCSIAGYGVGLYDSLTGLIERTVSASGTVTPRKELYAPYSAKKEIYAGIIGALHETYARLGDLEPHM